MRQKSYPDFRDPLAPRAFVLVTRLNFVDAVAYSGLRDNSIRDLVRSNAISGTLV
jgi:hypothetical protein